MKYDLAAMTRRARNPRRKVIALRPITAPAVLATNLYVSAYAPIIAVWSEALPSILEAYRQSLAAMTTDSPSDVAVRISYPQAEASSLFLRLRLRLEEWARKIEIFQRAKWRNTVLTATGVDLQTLIGPGDVQDTVGAVIEQNVALVSSVSDQARQRIADAVFRGFQRRAPAEEIGRELRDAVDMGRRRARNIAADQTVKIASALNDERRRQAGISAWEWLHSDKLHPRPAHVARNHHLYSDDPEQVGDDAEGKTVLEPPADRPGQLPFCGCTSRAVLILS